MNVDTESIIPSDNPFVGVQEQSLNKGDAQHDLLWVTGLRNPWKFSLLPDGRPSLRTLVKTHLRKYPSPRKETTWDGMCGKAMNVWRRTVHKMMPMVSPLYFLFIHIHIQKDKVSLVAWSCLESIDTTVNICLEIL